MKLALPTLQIQLLGEFHLVYDDEPVLIPQARLHFLLGYLALHRQTPQSRQRLSFLLSPDSSEEYARARLRKLLYELRQALPEIDTILAIDHSIIHWRDAVMTTVDVATFSALLAQAEQSVGAHAARVALEQAIALYGGELLPACYDDWVLRERERLQQEYLSALERLSALCAQQGDLSAALAYAQRFVQSDPLQEAGYRRLMHLYIESGDQARALRVFHTCATILSNELGVDPSAETQALYQQLLHMEGIAPAAPALHIHARSLIGRQREWENLLQIWQMAARGEPQFVFIAGEAGIGKSRLAEEMIAWANEQSITAIQARAYAAEGSLVYAPVRDWLRCETMRPILARLERLWLSEIGRLLPELFVEHPDLPHPEPLSDQWQRQRLFEALAQAFAAQPRLLLVLDDLQWCDRETLEWLHYLLRFNAKAHLLVVGTMRPEEVDAQHALTTLLLNLRGAGQLAEIELAPLNAGDSAALAAQVAEQELDGETATRLYQTTEGNPLFIVETVRAGFRGLGPDAEPDGHSQATHFTALPSKVQAVIQARLARLSPAGRDLAQLAAIIGREFTSDMLARAGGGDEETLVRGLDELWQRRIVRERGISAYDFSHDRLREAAYTDATPARRRLLHRRVAQALEHLHAAELDAVSGQIAAHYESAGVPEKAVLYYQQAAEVVQHAYAHAEATLYLHKALALLHHLVATPEHLRLELRLQFALGSSLTALRSASAPETREAFVRALKLAEQVGSDSDRFAALLRVSENDLAGGRLRQAYEVAHPCLLLAQSIGDAYSLMAAQSRLGVVLLHLGQWRAGRDYLEQAAMFADYHWDSYARRYTSQHKGLSNQRHLALVLWHLGYPDRAEASMNEVMAVAQELAHPYTLAATLVNAAWLQQLRREPAHTQALAQEGIILANQQNFRYYMARYTALEGWALAQQGQADKGIGQIQEGIAALLAMGGHLHQPTVLSLLAEVYGQIGQPEQGLPLLDQALYEIEATGQRFFEVEVYRLKGELLQLQGADAQQVEFHFLRALAVAREQEAKSLELRAATSLGRLWQQQGKSRQAYDVLAEIYSWFTEGFHTHDLKDAAALLDSLA